VQFAGKQCSNYETFSSTEKEQGEEAKGRKEKEKISNHNLTAGDGQKQK